MRYEYSLKGSHGYDHHHASCARFCSNVCRRFSSGRKQCFRDCMACRGRTKGRRAKHGWISCHSKNCGYSY